MDCEPSHRSIGMFSFIEPGCRSAIRPHGTIITRIVALSGNKVVPARIKTQWCWPATDQDSIEEVRVLTLGVKMLVHNFLSQLANNITIMKTSYNAFLLKETETATLCLLELVKPVSLVVVSLGMS